MYIHCLRLRCRQRIDNPSLLLVPSLPAYTAIVQRGCVGSLAFHPRVQDRLIASSGLFLRGGGSAARAGSASAVGVGASGAATHDDSVWLVLVVDWLWCDSVFF
ncbi:hypothetical protein CERZMDRAFT_121479 [Cercospora zeae-maydis SCOH1-5]|uniref:Uncharacterized protein n=1 Tax=Cercospora zeae-maydis SCOH1-5 TaxID=717836 RepID=A0A6A6FDF2_9PEZI|nr:hypothetical protein CERZMDRAFT_121479 [Cercospora zeae-maydis SCOH1-5]